MQRHFHEEIMELKHMLYRMGLTVQDAIDKACSALLNRDTALAWEVIRGDKAVDQMEIDVDEKGHSLIAVGQPMAVDLRMITMILKINTVLERIGDHAVNISEKTIYLAQEAPVRAKLHIPEMTRAVERMLELILEAFIKEDPSLAEQVLTYDDEVDNYNKEIYFQLASLIETKPQYSRAALNLLMISHNLERIGDLITNIAEDVIFMKRGKEVRHQSDEMLASEQE